jgi:hypothetical protein
VKVVNRKKRMYETPNQIDTSSVDSVGEGTISMNTAIP